MRLRGLVAATLLVTSVALAADARYDELKRVVDRNTGHAHMTRGVNMYTLVALRECVTDADIPVLTRMLSDHDRVISIAAAYVLADFGQPGIEALRSARATADARTKSTLEEAIQQGQSPTREAILSYPLTNKERSRIRSCRRR